MVRSAIERLGALTSDTERLRGEVLDARDELRDLQAQMEVRAEELEAAYEEAVRLQPNLPPYAQLVNRRR